MKIFAATLLALFGADVRALLAGPDRPVRRA